jgi:hypothetical protein
MLMLRKEGYWIGKDKSDRDLGNGRLAHLPMAMLKQLEKGYGCLRVDVRGEKIVWRWRRGSCDFETLRRFSKVE